MPKMITQSRNLPMLQYNVISYKLNKIKPFITQYLLLRIPKYVTSYQDSFS